MTLGLFAAASLCVASSTGRKASEDRVKAAFIYNFARYVTWPDPDGGPDDDALTVGILGDDSFAAALDKAAAGKVVKGQRIVVSRLRSLDDVAGCQMLFLAASKSHCLEDVLAKASDSHVLVVGDAKGLAQRGAAINFFVQRKRVRFEINRKAAKRAGLKISARLLRVARVVK